MLKTDLLAAKFRRPALPARYVPRPRLVERLNEGLALTRRVTLVSAPPGFGKTTCACEWLEQLQRSPAAPPAAWLALDPADDDPVRFWAYFCAALQTVDASLGRELAGALAAGQLPPPEILGPTLVNEVLALGVRFVLALDDFQVIQDPSILQVFETLLAGLPPGVHLVLLTREDPPLPLARLRANNQLTEIRARDLRFTARESGEFLNAVMGLGLSPAQAAELDARTEGWIAGLQLAGLSVRERDDPAALISGLSGSHRFILSYLTEQVLDRQPEEVRRFLLQTSILDTLNGELCDAVTGREDSRLLLERLYNANLFLIPLDDDRHWYRYHHLFADLLRGLQSLFYAGQTAGLHRRAGRWYARAAAGNRVLVGAAVRHALAAGDYALAVDLLEEFALDLIMQGNVKTVNGWVEALPAGWEARSPRTNAAFAWMHLLRGAYPQAAPYLERLQDYLSGHKLDEDAPALTAEWLAMQSLVLYMKGKGGDSAAAAAQALEMTPDLDDRVRSLVYYALGSARQMLGEYASAVEAFQAAIRHARAAENLVAEMMSTVGLARLAFEYGQLHLAYEIAGPVCERLDRAGSRPPISAVLYGLLAEVYIQWFELEPARRAARQALQLSSLGGYNSGVLMCHVLLARVARLAGGLETAEREMQAALERVPAEAAGYVREEVAAHQARLQLALGRSAAAELVLHEFGFSFRDGFHYPGLPPGRGLPLSLGLLYTSSLLVLLARAGIAPGTARLQAGTGLADRVIAAALPGEGYLCALEALLLRARLHALLGDPSAARADLQSALERAAPEGFAGVFVELGPPAAAVLEDLLRNDFPEDLPPAYVRRLEAALSGAADREPEHGRQPGSSHPAVPVPYAPTPAARIAAPVEPLSARELEVLRLMAEGLKYKEIAARLYISLNTVRSHTRAIYGKLGVDNRTSALKKARRLEIL